MLTLDKIFENFKVLDNWESRFKYIVELGRTLPDFPEDQKVEENRIKGCVSRAWLVKNESTDNQMFFLADSEAAIVKGLIKIVMVIYQDLAPLEILKKDLEPIFAKLQLLEHLSPNRANGFQSLIQNIKKIALIELSKTLR